VAESSFQTAFRIKNLRVPSFRKRKPRPPSQVTAIDVDGLTLRLAQVSPRGARSVVTRVAAAPLEFPPEADRSDPTNLGRAIARALAHLQLKPGVVVMGVPRAQVVLRTLLLPVIEDLRELASMVHFQLGRDLPFRMDEAVIDFKVRRKVTVAGPRPDAPSPAPAGSPADPKVDVPSVQKLEVLVAAVKRDVVDQFQQAADLAGLRLAALGLLPYANARCVEACRVAEGDQAFALVSLRPDEVNIDVIAQQSLLFSRGASVKFSTEPPPVPPASEVPLADRPLGAAETAVPDAPRPDAFVDAVTIEVVRSLHSYSGMEPDNPAAKIVVTGATGQEAAVVDALARRLTRPCALLDPVAALELSGQAGDQATGAIAAIGLALGHGDAQGLPFDFLNPKRPAVPRDLGRIRILAGIAAAAAVFMMVLAVRTYLINDRTRINREVAAQVGEAERNVPLYRRMIQQAAKTDEWVSGGSDWLAHYAYLSALLPPSDEIYLTSLTVSAQGTLRLTVQARSGEILAKLEKQLRAAGYEIKPLAITPGSERYGYEFRSNVELIVPKKLKIDLAKTHAPPARPSDDASLDPPNRRGGGG
jgi:Tfp pilus assembly PilM family ATPase